MKLFVFAFVFLASSLALLETNTNPVTANIYPAGNFSQVFFTSGNSNCAGSGCPALVQSFSFASGGNSGTVAVNGTSSITNVNASSSSTPIANCDATYGCPTVLSGVNPTPATITTGSAKAILLRAGSVLTFSFSTPVKAVGFSAQVTTNVLLTASTNNLAEGSVTHPVAPQAQSKPFFTVGAPYENTFTQLYITSNVTTWLVIDNFIFGETGYFCVNYETLFACELTVNLIDLPRQTTSLQVFGDGYQTAQNGNGYVVIPNTGGKLVMVCVPETGVPPRAVVTDNTVSYDSDSSASNNPICNANHQCYLDPRATLQVPVKCLPQADLTNFANGFTVNLTLWQRAATGSGNSLFRTLPLLSTNPTVTVLAIPRVFPSVNAYPVNVNPTNIVAAASVARYDCSKNATNPVVPANQEGACVYPLYANNFPSFPSLTNILQVRAKCSENQVPPMNQNVTLYIGAPSVNIYPLLYTVPNRGNVDTNVCVLSSGTYDVWATENGATTAILAANCPNNANYSVCNGTPLDIVSAIYTTGCTQWSRTCPNDPSVTWPSVGGSVLTGLYNVSLSYNDVVFRTEQANPFGNFATCVLNLNNVKLSLNVADKATVSATYDCTNSSAPYLYPTENICRRTDGGNGNLTLFSLLDVDLSRLPAGAISFNVNLVQTADGVDYNITLLGAHPVVAGTQGAGFCRRGGAIEHICVPAIGSGPAYLPCGNVYHTQAIQVYAEECGSGGNPVVTCNGTTVRRRDDGTCIRATDEVDCRNGTCSAVVQQDLCIWDLLYLPEAAANQTGIVVELLPPVTNNTIRSYTNQGGSPQVYHVLKGFLRVRISENPVGPLPDLTTAYIVSPELRCTLNDYCAYNDFLSIIDISGESSVTPVNVDDPTVSCSGITYNDNYNTPTVHQVLNGAIASISVGTRTFRGGIALAGCSGPLPCNSPIAVLRTLNVGAYNVQYSWSGLTRNVPSVSCTGKSCSTVPCVVRWIPVDPKCPDLRVGIQWTPVGVLPDTNDDPHDQLYRYTDVTSGPSLRLGGTDLCSETIRVDEFRNTACRNNTLTPDYAPTGFTQNPSMKRYFVLAQDATAAYSVSITSGCATAQYSVTCASDITQTGRKTVVNPSPGCVNPTQIYWHACTFNVPAAMLGQPQYWRQTLNPLANGCVFGPSSSKREGPSPAACKFDCLWANNITGRDPWVPLRPYTVISIDLTSLPNGTVPLVDQVNLTNSVPAQWSNDQFRYRGNNYTNFNGVYTNRVNPFDLSVCCGNCGSAPISSSRSSAKRGDCGDFSPPGDSCANGRILGAGGYDNLVCVLAGASYSFTVQELYRNETRENFLDFNPGLCPNASNIYTWNQRIIGCRPTACTSAIPASPTRYYASNFVNVVNKTADNIEWGQTYSTNYQCTPLGTGYPHTLLRPNRLATPAQSFIPYIKGKWYEFRCNNRNVPCHSDRISCLDNILAGWCIAPNNNLQSVGLAMRTLPQE